MHGTTNFVDTPRYLLKSGNQAIFPTINFENPNKNCVCVYGFSDKPIYDKFIDNSNQVLTPYPLVKRYLSNHIDEAASVEDGGDCMSLVILDAIDPAKPVLSAATMATVLLAYEENAKQVPVDIELIFDPNTASYQFKKRNSKSMVPLEPKDIAQ